MAHGDDVMFALCEEAFRSRLKLKATAQDPKWRLWQYKSLNLHRGIILLDARTVSLKLSEFDCQIRETVKKEFAPNWWRGFGFGVVVVMDDIDESFHHAASMIDVRNNSAGCWQWLMFVIPSLQSALGIQTWTEGYLAPVYSDLASKLQQAGFHCETHRKDMDELTKSLIKIHRCLRLATGGLDALIP